MKRRLGGIFLCGSMLCALLTGCGGEAGESGSQTEQLLEALFHQPYLAQVDIATNCRSQRENIIEEIAEALEGEPCALSVEDELFGGTYFAVTKYTSTLFYYGETKNNRPNGFGVVMETGSRDGDILFRYAGEFKKGRLDGYGAEFAVYNRLDQLSDTEYPELTADYLSNYVTYDGEWESGCKSGKGNYYDVSGFRVADAPEVEGYWGGGYYPHKIMVVTFKKDKLTGKAKVYLYQSLAYDGELKNGERDGEGVQYYANGQIQYKGSWKEGTYNGKGTLYDENGEKLYSGKWERGDYAS